MERDTNMFGLQHEPEDKIWTMKIYEVGFVGI